MQVQSFFQRDTGSLTYVVFDSKSGDAVVIDPCLDLNLSEMKLSQESLKLVVAFLHNQKFRLQWILETHVHADHVSGAQVLLKTFPEAKLAIGEGVQTVQQTFLEIFNLKSDSFLLGWPFDLLLEDGHIIEAGTLKFRVMTTPGHTQACVAYLCEDHLFTGDSLFMPEAGTGRCDFPGANAGQLFDSIQKLYQLKNETVVHVGHNYPPADEGPRSETTIGKQKAGNIHVTSTTTRQEFVQFRETRDRTLSLPRLFYPSLFLNIRGGRLPEMDEQGHCHISIPLTVSL